MSDDARPEFRCRCVHRERFILDARLDYLLPVSPYQDRCKDRPTQEDGLCDHCRLPEGCPCCAPAVRGSRGGCRWRGSERVLVDLTEPCAALPAQPTDLEGVLL